MKNPRTLVIALGTTATVALAAAPGLGADRCVDRGGCSLPNTYFGSSGLRDALMAAAADGDGRVLIGDGTYTAPTGGFSLSSTADVEIVGAGVGETIISTGPTQPDYVVALYVDGDDVTVRDLTVRIAHENLRGLAVYDGATGRNLRVEDGPSGTNTYGVLLEGTGSVLENAVIDLDLPGAQGVGLNCACTVRTTRIAASTGVRASLGSGPGTGLVSRTRITAATTGVTADSGSVAVRDSLIRMTGASTTGVQAANFNNGTNPIAIAVTRSTILGAGAPGQTGVAAQADSATGDNASVTVASSLIDGVGVPLRRSSTAGTATILTRYTNHTGAGVVDSGAGSLSETARTSHPVAFVDAAAGDLRPAPGSPLVDAGDPADGGTVDLDGGPRPLDGDGDGVARVDIGALEATHTPPPPSPDPPVQPPADPGSPAGPAPAPAGPATPVASPAARDRLAPRLTRLTLVRRGAVGVLRGRVSERGTLRVRIVRAGARGARVRVVPVRRAGAVTVRFALPRLGLYRVTVSARDRAGNTSRAQLRQVRRIAPLR